MLAQLNAHGDDPLTPVVVQRGIRRDQVDYLLEHSLQFPGVRMQDSFLRSYPYQSLAAQVVGYVGAISPAQYKARKKKGYQATDSIGQAGVESTYDTYLRGKDGKAQLTVDSRGRPKGAAVFETSPTPGRGAAADDRHQPSAGRRARASLRHQPGALELRGPARERRRDRRAQPEGRCGARDGVVPDLQAVDLRRPQGSDRSSRRC